MRKVFVRAIVERDGKYLVLKEHWSAGPMWNFPGGKPEPGENCLWRALFRELKEETLLVGYSYRISHTQLVTVDGEKWIGYYYHVKAIGEPCVREPWKCIDMAWVTEEELKELPCLEGSLDVGKSR